MKVTVCRDLSDRALSYDVEPGKLSDIFTFLELGNAVALVNGKIVEPKTVVSKDDIVFIRTVPKGLVAGLAIAAGVLLLAGAAYAGYQIYQMRRQMEKYKEGLSSFGNSVTNIPYVKGANNVKALDRSIPYIIGKARIAPYVLSEGKSTLYGLYGNMERGIPYVAGYGPLVLREMYSNGALVHEFSGDTPQEGSFNITSLYRGFGYVAQDGLEDINELFPFMKNTYVSIEPGDQLLKKDDPNYADLTYVLPENTASVEIFFMFNGLIKYTSDGKEKAHTVDIDLYWSKDGGSNWILFKPTGGVTGQKVNDGPVTFKRKSQFRMAADLALPYSAVSSMTVPLQIKVVCNSNAYSGAAQEDVFVQTIQSKVYEPTLSATANNYVFLPVLDETTAEKCCCIGYGGSARNTSEEEAFSNFALILEGVARTWDGAAWSSTKTPTDNPAAWLLEVLTSDIHPQSKLTDAELDLETFGELYEYCETEELTVSKVYVDGEPKEKIIQMLCDICFSTLYKNLDGKIAVATDKEKENAIAVINTQNCFSFTNKKDMAAPVDGLRVTFLNEANEYETDAYEVMRPGVTKDANSKIRALTADGITKYEQVVKYAWRLMAIESARPKVTTVEIGHEGVYYTPLSKVLVQHPSLKNGLGSAEIKNVVMSGTDIIGLDLYEPIVYDSTDVNGFGMVIQCVSDTYCTPLTKAYDAETDGLLYTVDFVTPIDTLTAPVIPHAGDILSYGYLDDGEFNTITNEMLITNMAQTERGWRLELVDYNPAIYEYGDIPVYTPHLTTKSPINYVPATPPAPTKGEVSETITESQGTLTISGVPVFADRETCIAECTIDEVHYLLYQDMSTGTENWEIVTINEDLSFTSFLTGSGVLNDMCQHDGKIFVSDDDGLYYIDTGELVQVYDDGIDSIQSDGGTLYAVKDGQFCGFTDDLSFYEKTLSPSVSVQCACLHDGVKYIGVGTSLYRFNSDTGAVELVKAFAGYVSALFSWDDVLYYQTGTNVYSYDIDGDVSTLYMSGVSNSGGIVVGDYFYTVGPFNQLYKYDLLATTYSVIYSESSTQAYVFKYDEKANFAILDSFGFSIFVFEDDDSYQRLIIGDSLQYFLGVYNGRLYFSFEVEEVSTFFRSTQEWATYEEIGIPPGTKFVQFDEETIVFGTAPSYYIPYPYSAPIPIDETVRNYGKIRLLGDTIFAAVTDGHIYRLQDSGLVQHTQSGDGYNAITYRNGRMYCASDYVVFELKAGGTVAAVENAVSENPIVEMFDYGDYLVWCPEYTPPDTGTLYAAFVNYPGNVNVYQNVTITLSADFPYGVTKTFRKMTAWDGTPVVIAPPSGGNIEGQSEVWLYGQYDYFNIERISETDFVISDRNNPSLDITASFSSLTGFPIKSRITLRRTSAYNGTAFTISAPSGTSFEGAASVALYGQYSYVELERISATVFAIKEWKDKWDPTPKVSFTTSNTGITYSGRLARISRNKKLLNAEINITANKGTSVGNLTVLLPGYSTTSSTALAIFSSIGISGTADILKGTAYSSGLAFYKIPSGPVTEANISGEFTIRGSIAIIEP